MHGLVLALLLLAAWMPAASAAHYVVCTADNPPMSTCNITANPSTYSGFDVELFRSAAQLMGWTESEGGEASNASQPQGGDTFELVCRPFSDVVADLTAPGGTCTLAAAGITISSEREDRGIKFSFPTYHSSLAIMVYAEEKQDTGWFFLRPFDWTVWLAIALTVAAIPAITFVTEFISIEGRIQQRDVVPGMKEASWRSLWTMMLLEPFQVTAISSRVIAVIYGFLATVLVNTYCANLTAALTVSQLATSIQSVEDLRGKAVGTVAVYVSRLAKLGIAAAEIPFDSIESALNVWVPMLQQGTLVATAVDEPIQQFVAALGGCSLRLVDTFAPFDFGAAFRVGTNQSFIDALDDKLLVLQEDGTAEELRTTFIAIPRTECASNVDESTSITFSQVAGLWIVLAAGVGLALIWLLGLRLWVSRQHRAAVAAASTAPDRKLGEKAGSATRRHALQQQSSRRHSFKAGVAFRQTVSIYGAQIAAARRDLEAAALEEAGRAGSGLTLDGSGSAPAAGHEAPGSPMARVLPEDQSVAQLLAHVRQLCDRMEAHAETSYMEGGQRIVDERIEEVPELD